MTVDGAEHANPNPDRAREFRETVIPFQVTPDPAPEQFPSTGPPGKMRLKLDPERLKLAEAK